MSKLLSLEVPSSLEGERLDRSLALLLGISRSQASKLIAEGSVHLKGKPLTAPATRLTAGTTLRADAEAVENLQPKLVGDPDVSVEIVHEDPDLLVLEKAPNVVVHPGSGNLSGTLVAGLLARFPEISEVGEPDRPGIVHRLDKGTSGLMVVARSNEAYGVLVEMFSRHVVVREYLAFCQGVPQNDKGTIDAPIGRSPRRPTEMTVVASGREAITHYEVIQRFANAALLKCQLETGRTHQIRVHLAAIGHSVLGDDVYSTTTTTATTPNSPPLTRPALHSSHLSLAHPITAQPLSFTSPLPPDLTQLQFL